MNIKEIEYFNSEYKDIPNEILSNLSLKGFVGKWAGYICFSARNCLRAYYLDKKSNEYAGDLEGTLNLIGEEFVFMFSSQFILADLFNYDFNNDSSEALSDLIDIIKLVYGADSSEVYLFNSFVEMYAKLDESSSDGMWLEDCEPRLYDILKLE